jgi:hypothetical protein
LHWQRFVGSAESSSVVNTVWTEANGLRDNGALRPPLEPVRCHGARGAAVSVLRNAPCVMNARAFIKQEAPQASAAAVVHSDVAWRPIPRCDVLLRRRTDGSAKSARKGVYFTCACMCVCGGMGCHAFRDDTQGTGTAIAAQGWDANACAGLSAAPQNFRNTIIREVSSTDGCSARHMTREMSKGASTAAGGQISCASQTGGRRESGVRGSKECSLGMPRTGRTLPACQLADPISSGPYAPAAWAGP